ncbi:hypothetical protein [Streptomyces venezuelae]|uniref:hypothetical protein n=1 Tax=Streptomyces venezuelae TaxID=54571 RepID=UPI001CC245C4|nr:hypothetical protein [Streptomyces venezuelae]
MRLTHGASESDIGALKAWLEREQKLEELRNRGKLAIEERAGTGESGHAMGAGLEIVLVLVGVVAAKLFDEVYEQVKSGVRAWQQNRRAVERGEPPTVEITPDDGER